MSLGKVPTLYSKISDTEPKEPSCSIEKIIADPFPNASENFQNLEIENENNINFLRSLKGFRVGHINIASLVKHIDELKIYLEKEPFDILSINESRLDETISTDVVSIPGYEMIVKNRNRVGGGVAIYYRSVLNVMNRQDLIPANVEAVCLKVTRPKSKPILITSVYRPPNSRIELLNDIETLF